MCVPQQLPSSSGAAQAAGYSRVKLLPAVWSDCTTSAKQRRSGSVHLNRKSLSELFLLGQFLQNCAFSSTCKKIHHSYCLWDL